MRGGSTDSCLVAGTAALRTPPIVARAWAALAMHDRFFAPTRSKLESGSVVYLNEGLFEGEVGVDGVRVFPVAATRLAAEADAPMSGSLVLASAFCASTGFASQPSVLAAMRECVPSYRQQHVEANERAIAAGFAVLPELEAPAWAGEAAA